MSFNPKNKLQEYFQSLNLDIPKYNTFRQGGEEHNPHFISYIELDNGELCYGLPRSKKREAEKSAAEEFLKSIENKDFKIEGKKDDDIDYEIQEQDNLYNIIIDTENQPKLTEKICSQLIESGYLTENVYITFVFSRNYQNKDSIITKVENLDLPNLDYYKTQYKRENSADLAICIIAKEAYDSCCNVILVSNDNLIDTYKDILYEYCNDEEFIIKNFVNGQELFKYLNNY